MTQEDWNIKSQHTLRRMLEEKGYNIPESQNKWLQDIIKYIRVRASTNYAITYREKSNKIT